jgi:ABC-type uncharacterized transport system permease subunit
MIYGFLGLINLAPEGIYWFRAFVTVLRLVTGRVNFFLAFAAGMAVAAVLGWSGTGWPSGPCRAPTRSCP